jgi:AcrR family transcriptional regulator
MARQRIDSGDVTDAALDVLDASGSDELTLSKVANELGVQSSALYNHVEGLSGLRQGVALKASEALERSLRDAAIARSGRDALWAVGDAYRRFAAQHPGQFGAATLAIGEPAQEITDAITSTTALFTRIVESFGVGESSALDDARAIHSAVRGFVILERTEGFHRDADVDAAFEHLLELLVRGLGSDRT